MFAGLAKRLRDAADLVHHLTLTLLETLFGFGFDAGSRLLRLRLDGLGDLTGAAFRFLRGFAEFLLGLVGYFTSLLLGLVGGLTDLLLGLVLRSLRRKFVRHVFAPFLPRLRGELRG